MFKRPYSLPTRRSFHPIAHALILGLLAGLASAHAESGVKPGDGVEEYLVQRNDSLSEILYRKGIVFPPRRIYGPQGYLERTLRLNPDLKDWDRLRPGQHIRLALPEELVGGPEGEPPPRRLKTKPEPQPKPAPTPEVIPSPPPPPVEPAAPASSWSSAGDLAVGALSHGTDENVSGQVSATRNQITIPYAEFHARFVRDTTDSGKIRGPEIGVWAGFGANRSEGNLSFPATYRFAIDYSSRAPEEERLFFSSPSYGLRLEYRNLVAATPDLTGTGSPLPTIAREAKIWGGYVWAEAPFTLFGNAASFGLSAGHSLQVSSSGPAGARAFPGSLSGFLFAIRAQSVIGELFHRPLGFGLGMEYFPLQASDGSAFRQATVGASFSLRLF